MSELEQSLFSSLHHFASYMHTLHREKRGFELERGQGRLLRLLVREDGISQQDLAQRLSIKPGSLSELIKKVEEKGYLRREVNPKDKRKYSIFITPEGKKIADLMIIARQETSHDVFSVLTIDEQKQLFDILKKLMNNKRDTNKTYHKQPDISDKK